MLRQFVLKYNHLFLHQYFGSKLDWRLKITKSKLGLEYLETVFSEFDDPKVNSTTFLFKVINRKKLLWAKMMYGI
jgi:hypothetical protein